METNKENQQTNETSNLYDLNNLIDNVSSKFKLSKEQLQEKLNNWKEQKINIGFIGESGCGKSTLINAIRGLYPNDKDAAKTDVKECTKYPTPYPFSNNQNIILWDLPGVNTPSFPLKTYLEKIKLNKEKIVSEKYKKKLKI